MAKKKKHPKRTGIRKNLTQKNSGENYMLDDDIPIITNPTSVSYPLMVRRDKIRGDRSIPPILIPDTIYMNHVRAQPSGQTPDPSILELNTIQRIIPRRIRDYTGVFPESNRLTIEYMQAVSAAIPHMSETQLCKFDLINVESFKYADRRKPCENGEECIPTNAPYVTPVLFEIAEDGLMVLLPDLKEYLLQNPFWSYVPCFKEGTIKANRDRYFYYRVDDIDATNLTLSIFIKSYYKYQDIWVPSLHADLSVKWSYEENDIIIDCPSKKPFDMPDWLNAVDLDTLDWTPTEKEIWELMRKYCRQSSLTESQQSDKLAGHHTGLSGMHQIAIKFFGIVVGINQMISSHKQTIIANKIRTIKTKPLDDDHIYESIIRNRTIRQFGPVSIASKTTPTLPSERSASNYTMPTWKQRGHLRTYKKTGKQVWIEELTKKRHVLNNDNTNKTPGITINVYPTNLTGKDV